MSPRLRVAENSYQVCQKSLRYFQEQSSYFLQIVKCSPLVVAVRGQAGELAPQPQEQAEQERVVLFQPALVLVRE